MARCFYILTLFFFINLIYLIDLIQSLPDERILFPCNETKILNNRLNHLDQIQDRCYLRVPDDEINWQIAFLTIKQPLDSDYIKSSWEVCGSLGAQVMLIDEFSKKILDSYSFNQSGEVFCSEMRTFISDSNQIRVEYTAFDLDNNATQSTQQIEFNFFNETKPTEPVVFNLKIKYEPIHFTHESWIFNESSSFSIDNYVPNKVWTFVIQKPAENEDEFKIGVVIEIDYLDLDFDRNDYLLIGPGERPSFWVNSKSQIVTRRIFTYNDKMRFYINADSAFVKVVTHNSHKVKHKVLEAHGIQANKTIQKDKNSDLTNRIKEAAIQLCFDEICRRWKEHKNRFVDEFVHYLNNYLVDPKSESNISILVDKDSIRIFEEEDYSTFCRINLAVVSPYDPEYPLVSRNTLHQMYFGNSHSRKILSDTSLVTDCTTHNITYLKIIIPIIVIITISTMIVVAFWRLQTYLIKAKYSSLKGNN